VRLIAPDGRELAQGQASANPAALATVEAGCDLAVTDPALWSTQAPLLHTLEVDLVRNGQVIDRRRLRLGFRTIRFDADKGFFLNGKPLKIKGVCIHQDHAGVGVALPDALWNGGAPPEGHRLQRHPLHPPCPAPHCSTPATGRACW
jgi:beta-galactosidase